MEPSSDFKKRSFFTREQILWLMNFLGAKSLLGVNLKDSPASPDSRDPVDSESISHQLEEKGILRREGKETLILNPDIRPILDALFFPDRAMIVARDRPSIGSQIFYFLRKGPVLIMHSFPREGEHILLRISKPLDIVQILVDWLPLGFIPSSTTDLLMEPEAFTRFVHLARRDERKEALEALRDLPEEESGKTDLLNAIEHRKLSGTIGVLVFQSNMVDDASCINVLTDGVTAWMITHEESYASRGPHLRVQRTGADFAMTVRGLVERFAGEKLPRQQIDASAKVTRFVLTLDEIALALASINCPELSLNMAAAASRGSSAGPYPERMQAAEQTLLDHGLCKRSSGGIPDLEPDLARAVFTIAQSDCMIDLKACRKDVPVNSCIHIVHGRFFTAYYNYGSTMQLLEFGSYKDLPAYLEFLFPDFGNEHGIQVKNFTISYPALEKTLGSIRHRENAGQALRMDGLNISDTNALLEDLSESDYRASFFRRDAPESRDNTGTAESVLSMPAILLIKSPRRSLLIRFMDSTETGIVHTVNHGEFLELMKNFTN